MATTQDPFLVLSLPYDADAGDVRRAFRRLARETHPDQGGSSDAFHEIRVAYDVLTEDLDGERQRWNAPPPPRASRYAGGLDARAYPTCRVRLGRSRAGVQTVDYEVDSRPSAWRPGGDPPPGGICQKAYPATEAFPAFGVWAVPLDAERARYVFGPSPPGD